MVPDDLIEDARILLQELRRRNLQIATAESCTGGLICAILTAVEGASDVVDRGFVTYSNAAKSDILGVPASLIEDHGAVSGEVAVAMSRGALTAAAPAHVSVAVTGIAGPGGGTPEKPVGLVQLAVARRDGGLLHRECRYGDIGRNEVRLATVRTAFALVREIL